jgi:hypothetical protein
MLRQTAMTLVIPQSNSNRMFDSSPDDDDESAGKVLPGR